MSKTAKQDTSKKAPASKKAAPKKQAEGQTAASIRQVPIANRVQDFTGDPAKLFKSYQHKATAVSSYKRKVSYHARRGETVPTQSHGLSKAECTELLQDWGITLG